MNNAQQNRILLSIKKLMGGVIRLSLRNGLTYKQFAQICRSLYVDICSKEYGIQGRPTNVSRIALMTGLDRKEIKKVLDNEQGLNKEEQASPDRIAKILTTWHQDPLYLDKRGKPLLLPIEGEKLSFEQLTKNFRGDMPSVTILRELKRSKTVVENKHGLLELKKPYYIPNYFSKPDQEPELVNPEAIEHGSSMLVDHINTVFYNLYRKDKSLRERIELRATNHEVAKSKIQDFYNLVDKKAMELLYEVDDWLQKNEAHDPSEETERLGLGVYFIEGPNSNTPPQLKVKKTDDAQA